MKKLLIVAVIVLSGWFLIFNIISEKRKAVDEDLITVKWFEITFQEAVEKISTNIANIDFSPSAKEIISGKAYESTIDFETTAPPEDILRQLIIGYDPDALKKLSVEKSGERIIVRVIDENDQ